MCSVKRKSLFTFTLLHFYTSTRENCAIGSSVMCDKNTKLRTFCCSNFRERESDFKILKNRLLYKCMNFPLFFAEKNQSDAIRARAFNSSNIDTRRRILRLYEAYRNYTSREALMTFVVRKAQRIVTWRVNAFLRYEGTTNN